MSRVADEVPTASLPILVVDDHRANLIAMEAVLMELGHPLVTALGGAEALELARAHDFVMILVDVHMPATDGYETATRLRQIDRSHGVPIVFLTAVYDQPEHTHRGYALGAVDYISKPFDPVVLRAKVRALVALYVRGERAERVRSKRADQMKDLFLGAVGHDLRSPLQAIVMASRLLSVDECSNETRKDMAARVDRAAHRMGRIVEDILDLTRGLFTDGIPVRAAPVDLAEICRAVVGEQRTRYPKRSVELDVTGDVAG